MTSRSTFIFGGCVVHADGVRGGKILKGFRKKEAAEKYAAKVDGVLDRRLVNRSKAEIEAYKKWQEKRED